MASFLNQAHVLFSGIPDLSFSASTAVTGRRFVSLGAFTSGPGLSATGEGSNITGHHSTAAGRTDGVSRYDVALNKLGSVVRSKSIVQVDCGGSIAAEGEVEVGAAGKAVALASGVPVGKALTAGVNNATAYILIY